jgi:hypothetical protein
MFIGLIIGIVIGLLIAAAAFVALIGFGAQS